MAAVLFDFSGTLFRIEPAVSWLRAALTATGHTLPDAEVVRMAAELEAVGAQPGGLSPVEVPEDLAEMWAVRDESAEAHRAAFTGLSRQVPMTVPGLHDALYARHMEPEAWAPYPDAAPVLRTLRERGAGIAVVSNIGWDLRPVFRAHGLDAYVDAYVLSYEYGVQKPDVRLFAAACERLGVAPEETLMVGDSKEADGGAAELGCRVHFVEHLPVDERPDGLLPALDQAR
ncbi:HAD-IA family hydrolase [Streptomyces sp. J2-1]|uniref:HAD family hydrolase n=1 Tax=Streptomyces corallincola TaxID=2851888 RepID=UPI001C394B75|nr:HAD-IA family hydrolase [Streptomyces corallincola]MBV2352853.1 HAD-IA family hydrolase [Streptomyces corallincola]